LNSESLYTLSHSTSPFLWWVFWDRVSRTSRTITFLISASWVARITGVSHQHLAKTFLKGNFLVYLGIFNNANQFFS
jgi:hypothetical protein